MNIKLSMDEDNEFDKNKSKAQTIMNFALLCHQLAFDRGTIYHPPAI